MGRIEYQDYQPKHLSYSTVNSYRSCGKRLYFEKVLKLEQHPGFAAIGGNAVHHCTEVIDMAAWEASRQGIDNRNGGSGK
jgi:hypothetical protein